MISCKKNWGRLFSFQSQFLGPKISLIFLKTIFVSEYYIRRTCFIKIIFNFVHIQKNLFSKTLPYFWCLRVKLSYNKWNNPFRGFTGVQKLDAWCMLHYEIPYVFALQWTLSKNFWYLLRQFEADPSKIGYSFTK